MVLVSDVLMCQLNGIFDSILDFIANAALIVLCENFYFLSNLVAFVVRDTLNIISGTSKCVFCDEFYFVLNAVIK